MFGTLTAGIAYAVFFITADFTVRDGVVSPFYVFTLGGGHLVRLPFKLVEGIWGSIVGGLMTSMPEVTLTSRIGLVATAYGTLVAGLLLYGSRTGEVLHFLRK